MGFASCVRALLILKDLSQPQLSQEIKREIKRMKVLLATGFICNKNLYFYSLLNPEKAVDSTVASVVALDEYSRRIHSPDKELLLVHICQVIRANIQDHLIMSVTIYATM